MLTKLTLHTLLAALVLGAAAFAWQARDDGPGPALASFAEVLGRTAGAGEDNRGDDR